MPSAKSNKKYIGFDRVATAKRPATEKLVELCNKRWDSECLGTLVVRQIRNKTFAGMSVHSTGRAADILIKDPVKKQQAIDWFTRTDVSTTLGIQELHVYDFGKWGKGWRVGRGWKDWTRLSNGGSVGAKWLHIELDYLHSSASAFEDAWRSLPKPT